jgi:tricorn protease
MLMGELNASHIAFEQTSASHREWNPEYKSRQGWHARTAALGLRFDETFTGQGLKIRQTVHNSPVDRVDDPLVPGEILLEIDGLPVDSKTDLTQILTDHYPRLIKLKVQSIDGDTRTVDVEEEGISNERELMRDEWMEFNRKTVERLSDGRLGYLDIKSMNFSSLRQFEKEIYARGFGKDGLVIDVRNNGGGFTSDYLLAILCHPRHAVTIPRNGEECYQQGYLPSAAWFKPITVLCNQYSASNAEIFSHAIKNLKRGKIVGIPTQGAVISTSSESILDIGSIRMPHRGWFTINDGQDMEYKPCIPDYIVPVQPGDIAAGNDPQLEKAVDVLMAELEANKNAKTPRPIYASEERLKESQRH